MAPRSIFVFGITGNQGGSVARALLKDGVRVTGLTRNVESAKAKRMAALGAHLVQGDMDDAASFAPHLEGVDAVFLTLDFWQHYTGGNALEAQSLETAQGVRVVDAVAAARVPHLIFSTLASFDNPPVAVPHFDSKAAVTARVQQLGLPATLVYAGYYYQNLLAQIRWEGGGVVVHNPMPDDTPLPSLDIDGLGAWVRPAFHSPEQWIGMRIDAVAEYVTVGEYAEELGAALGVQARTLERTLYGFLTDTETEREWWVNFLAVVNGQMTLDVASSAALVPDATQCKDWIRRPEVLAQIEALKSAAA